MPRYAFVLDGKTETALVDTATLPGVAGTVDGKRVWSSGFSAGLSTFIRLFSWTFLDHVHIHYVQQFRHDSKANTPSAIV